jgi:hypothetical protein
VVKGYQNFGILAGFEFENTPYLVPSGFIHTA